MMPPVQNRKLRMFRAVELRGNLLEIEVSEVDIYNTSSITSIMIFTILEILVL
jgi:hypothetical protein